MPELNAEQREALEVGTSLFGWSDTETALRHLEPVVVAMLIEAQREAVQEVLADLGERVRAAQDEVQGGDFGTVLVATVNAYSDACRAAAAKYGAGTCSTCGGSFDSPPCSLNREIGWSGHTVSGGTAAGESAGLAVTADGLAGIAKAAAEGGRAVGQADARADLARVWQEGHVAGEIDAHAPPNKYPTPNPYAAAGGDGR